MQRHRFKWIRTLQEFLRVKIPIWRAHSTSKRENRFSVYKSLQKNITDDFNDNTPTAIFEPEKAAKLLQSRTYLSCRVTLTNIINISTNASLKFQKLKCIDEKEYMCRFFYYDMVKLISLQESEATRISVKSLNFLHHVLYNNFRHLYYYIELVTFKNIYNINLCLETIRWNYRQLIVLYHVRSKLTIKLKM